MVPALFNSKFASPKNVDRNLTNSHRKSALGKGNIDNVRISKRLNPLRRKIYKFSLAFAKIESRTRFARVARVFQLPDIRGTAEKRSERRRKSSKS